MTRPAILLLSMLGIAGPAAAQTPLVGTWKISFPAGARVENGVQSLVMGAGTLKIAAQGDSLIGELTSEPVENLPARGPSQMIGVAGNPTALIAKLTTLIDINGEQHAVTVRSTWQLQAKGDSLIGSLSHKVEGDAGMAQDPGPVRGVRIAR